MIVSEGLTHAQTDEVTVELELSLFDDMDGARLIFFNLSTKTIDWVYYCMTVIKGEACHSSRLPLFGPRGQGLVG